MRHLTARTASVAVAAVVVVAALAGCSPNGKPTASPAAGGTGAATPVATPTPTPTPTDPPTPVTMTCDQLLTADQLYAFNPNFGPAPGYAPAVGSLEKKIGDWKGVTCAWQNQTSGDIVQIAVAEPPKSALDGLKNQAITVAQPVPTYGAPPLEGYFKPGDAGQVQIFRGSYWIVAESKAFFEPGDAAPLMQSVLGNVPAN